MIKIIRCLLTAYEWWSVLSPIMCRATLHPTLMTSQPLHGICVHVCVCVSFEQLLPSVWGTAQFLWPLGHIRFDIFLFERGKGDQANVLDNWPSVARGGQPGGQQLTCKSCCSLLEWDQKRGKMRRHYNLLKVLTQVLTDRRTVKYLVERLKQSQSHSTDRALRLNPWWMDYTEPILIKPQ